MAAIAPAAAGAGVADPESISQKVPARSQPRGKRERPCDGCRRRKGRCVPVEGQNQCTACAVHNQPCTYLEDPKPRKRKTENGMTVVPALVKKKSHSFPAHDAGPALAPHSRADQAGLSRSQLAAGAIQNIPSATAAPFEHYSYIGLTTEHEPLLIKTSSKLMDSGIGPIRDYGKAAFFVKTPNTTNAQSMISAVQVMIKPHLSGMAEAYRQNVHESFPILDDLVITQFYAGNVNASDTLVAAAMLLAVMTWYERNEERQNLPRIDRATLEGFVFGLFTQSLYQPSLHTVQTGLLLMQCPGVDTRALNMQVAEVSYELGLNLDCTSWDIAPSEKALRRRLAWAVYMQDQWCALVHGRPCVLSFSDWVVRPLSESDFPSQAMSSQKPKTGNAEHISNASQRRYLLFIKLVQLTRILADVISSFHSVSAQHNMEGQGPDGLRFVLEEVKRVQVPLKEWFNSLPSFSRMDLRLRTRQPSQQDAGSNGASGATAGSGKAGTASGGSNSGSSTGTSTPHGTPSSTTGFLFLAYYATEITLHRSIIRAQPSDPLANPTLVAIVRTAAKERLISALEFTNRLRGPALAGFWYFPARICFAIIGTFGTLLAATAPAREEADFYAARLKEYRWTLGVASRHAPWLAYAARHLDNQMVLVDGLGEKPTAGELAELREKRERRDGKARRRSGGAAGAGKAGMAGRREGGGLTETNPTGGAHVDAPDDDDDDDDDVLVDDDEDEYEEFEEEINEEELEEIERQLDAEDRANEQRERMMNS